MLHVKGNEYEKRKKWDSKARKNGHPDIDRLEKLAKVISEDAPIDILEEKGNQ